MNELAETDQHPPQQMMTGRQWIMVVALSSLALTSVVTLIGSLWTGSMPSFVQRANGHELIVEFVPPLLPKDGTLKRNDHGNSSVHIPVHVANLSTTPRTLLGGTSDCHCVATNGLPQDIDVGNEALINVSVQLSPGESAIDHVVTLYTDSPVDPVLTFRVVSRDQ